MNLINDAWIPARRKNGEKIKIAPYQTTENFGMDKEVAELAAPRPDFNGALIQFLIGLLQTTCTPQNTGEWRKWLENPPSPEELKERFESVAFAFNLDGDGPRFMQESGLEKEKEKSLESIDKLIIDMPGEQTLKYNKDHFVKRGRIKQLCPCCLTMALITLQVNAPSGGQGHLTGLRGGGPMTTLVYGNTVWETIWLNILEESRFKELANIRKNKDEDKFPWLNNSRNSENRRKTTPQDVHPFHLFWAVPRRLFIIFEQCQQKTECDLCGEYTRQVVKQYYSKTRGIDYKGAWRHPLSPMYLKASNKKNNEPDMWLPVHQHENIGYKHWLGYVLNDDKRIPALVVSDIISNKMFTDFRLWAFGYDMDNMKARCWYEGKIPVVLANEKYRESFNNYILNTIKTAEKVASDIAWCIKEGLYDVKIEANKKKDFSFVKGRFWQETEPEFYKILNDLRNFVVKNSAKIPEEILKHWLRYLVKEAEELFDDVTQSGEFSAVDPGRVAKAWNKLKWKIDSDETKEILGLPVAPKLKKTKAQRKGV